MNLQDKNLAAADAAVASSVSARQGGAINAANQPAPQSPVTASVVTSKAAQSDLDNIRRNTDTVTNDIASQQAALAQSKLVADQANAAKAQQQNADKLAQDKLALDKQAADAKTAAVSGLSMGDRQNLVEVRRTPIGAGGTREMVEYSDGTRKEVPRDITQLSPDQVKLDDAQAKGDELLAKFNSQSEQVSKAILDIQNGVIPLNAGQQAQVQGVANMFQQYIEAQKLTNIGATNSASIRGYQKGSAEYDPSFQVKTIGSIASAGANKIADLAVKGASAVAQLTEAFKSDNIKAIKDSYSIYKDAYEKHAEAVEKTITDTQEAIKASQAALKATQDDINEVLVEAAKNGADAKTLESIEKSGSVGGAVAAAGDFLQSGTGIVGEYAVYKRDATSRGLVPLTFDEYQTRDANRKAAIARAGDTVTAGGYTVNQEKTITSVNDAVSKNETYKKTSNMRGYADNVLVALNQQTGVGDIAAINQFQKVIDEGAVTRDQDVTLIKGAQSFLNRLALKKDSLAEGDQLSPELRSEMKKTVEDMYASQIKALNKDPYIVSKKKDVERNGIKVEDTILGELGGFSTRNDIIDESEKAYNSIQDYIKQNPKNASIIAQNAANLAATLDREPTDAEYLEAYPNYID